MKIVREAHARLVRVVAVAVTITAAYPTIANAEQAGGVPGASRADAGTIDAGYRHTCVILDSGALRCWGENGFGQLGQGNTATIGDNAGESTVPVDLGPGRTATAITAGYQHTCAMLDTRRGVCWGIGGVLGQGSAVGWGGLAGETPGGLSPIAFAGRLLGRDTDGDGVRDAVDACLAVASTGPSGCPLPTTAPTPPAAAVPPPAAAPVVPAPAAVPVVAALLPRFRPRFRTRADSRRGRFGQLRGATGFKDQPTGTVVRLRCVRACTGNGTVVLSSRRAKKRGVVLPRWTRISRRSIVEVRVTLAGSRGRWATYKFRRVGGAIIGVRLEQGCLTAVAPHQGTRCVG